MDYFYIFVLKELLEQFFGIHYPKEIIGVIILLFPKLIKISCGAHYTILIKDKIYVWGSNSSGQLGLGHKEYLKNQKSPKELNLNLHQDIKSIHCGWDFTIALTSKYFNKIYVWGNNEVGELGLGDRINRYSPTERILNIGAEIESIGCGSSHTIISLKSGECYSWGDNDCGQLGLGDTEDTKCTLNKIIFDPVIITSISCGFDHNIVLTKTNKCYVWGQNDDGQLGLGHFVCESSPRELLDLSNIISISCGEYHTVVLIKNKNKNKCYVWGNNIYGQLGVGHNDKQNSPQELKLKAIVSVSCGNNNTMALTTFGKLYSWGRNIAKSDNHCQNLPQEIYFKESIKSFHCGCYHTVLITIGNRIYIWGSNCDGQLGLGDKKDQEEPSELEFFNH